MAAPTLSTTSLPTGLVAALAAGALVVSGGIGLAVGVAGAGENGPGEERAVVALHTCPGEEVVGELRSGDRVWLTGRSRDGDWLELRDPLDPTLRRWLPAALVDGDGADDELEVVEDCGETVAVLEPVEVDREAPGDGPSEEATGPEGDEDGEDPGEGEEADDPSALEPADPGAPGGLPAGPGEPAAPVLPGRPSAGVPSPGPAPAPSPRPAPSPGPGPAPAPGPSPGPAPTPPPAPTNPTIGSVSRSAGVIRENFPGACDTGLPTTSTVSTSTSHPSGITSVQVRRRLGSGAWSGWQTVANGAGPVSFQVGPYPPGTAPAFGSTTVSWQLRATSNAGTSTTVSSTANQNVELRWCSLG